MFATIGVTTGAMTSATGGAPAVATVTIMTGATETGATTIVADSIAMIVTATAGGATMTATAGTGTAVRSEEHTSELQSLMRISYAVFCLKNKNKTKTTMS